MADADVEESTRPAVKDDENATIANSFGRYLLWASVIMAAFLIALNASLISTAVPTISTYFHSVDDLGWYGTAYLLADCSLQPLSGKLYQNLPLKWTFISFLTVFVTGSIISGAANSSNMLIVGRAIAGLGGSGISNGAMSIISASAPLEKRPVIISLLMASFGIGMVIGPLLGGVITQHASWRWCFFTTVVAAVSVIIVLTFSHVPDRADKKSTTPRLLLQKLDLVGFLLFAPACVMLLLAVYYGGASVFPWKSAQVIGLFCGFGGAACAFVLWMHHRGEEAMIPLSFFKSRIVVASCATGFFQFGGQIVVSYYLAIWLQAVKGVSPSTSGVFILPLICADLVANIAGGVFTQRIGYYLPPALLGCILTTTANALFTSIRATTPKATWMGFEVLAGAGRGLVFLAPVLATQTHLPATQTDIGNAIVMFSQFLGAALFLSSSQAIFNASLTASIRSAIRSAALPADFNAAAVVAAGATGFRKVFAEDEVRVLVGCFDEAVGRGYILAAAGAGASLLACSLLGWKSVKGRKQGGQVTLETAEKGPGAGQAVEHAIASDSDMEKEVEKEKEIVADGLALGGGERL